MNLEKESEPPSRSNTKDPLLIAAINKEKYWTLSKPKKENKNPWYEKIVNYLSGIFR